MAKYYAKKVKQQELTKDELKVLSNIPTKDVLEKYKGVQHAFNKQQEMENYLVKEANNFLKKYFNETLDIPLKISPRMTSNLGLFYATRSGTPIRIAITSTYFRFEQKDISRLMSTVFHECVHYVLCKKGLRYFDDDLVFDMILNRLNIYTNYRTDQEEINSPYDLYVCQCGSKKCVYQGTKKVRNLYWVICDKCFNPISFVRQEVGVYARIREDFEKEVELQSV